MKEFSIFNGYGVKDPIARKGITEATGTVLKDGVASPMELVSMSGNSVQKAYAGNQLVNLPDLSATTYNGIVWSCKDGYVTAKGTSTESSSSIQVGLYYDIPIVAGTYFVSGNQGSVAIYVSIIKADGSRAYPTNASFTLDGTETLARVYCQVNSGYTVDTTVYPFVNKGATKLQEEPYVGGVAVPNPDSPQSIHNVGDCVEMIQGLWVASGHTNNALRICSKNSIPCTSGDVIVIKCEVPIIAIFAYDSANNILGTYASENSEYELQATMPSGADYFKINLGNNDGLTPSTLGKATLTINGKYVVQIAEENKNFFYAKFSGTPTVLTFDEVTQTYTLPVSKSGAVFMEKIPVSIPKGKTVTLSVLAESGKYTDSANNINVSVRNSSSALLGNALILPRDVEFKNNVYSTTFELTDDVMFLRLYKDGSGNTNVTNEIKLKIQLEIGDKATEWVAHKEKVATVLLEAPLRDTDVMSRTEVVRKRASVVFDGSETWYMGNGYFYIKVENGAETRNVLSTHYKNDGSSSTTKFGNIWINNASQLIVVDNRFASASDFKSWLAENNVTVEYELATPIVETLDSTSQIALNSLETFDGVTYINVDSRAKPKEIKTNYASNVLGAKVMKLEGDSRVKEFKFLADGKYHAFSRSAGVWLVSVFIPDEFFFELYMVCANAYKEISATPIIDRGEICQFEYIWDMGAFAVHLPDDQIDAYVSVLELAKITTE
jgi:hypothetical protein